MLDYELELELASELESDFESGDYEADYEADYESEEFLGGLLRRVAPMAVRALGGLFRESELEGELELEGDFEDEFEFESEADFETKMPTSEEALMEQLADEAIKANSEAEAEAFFGAIASLAAKALPAIASKVVPGLVKGVSRLGRSLFRRRRSRRLIRAVPHIVRRTGRTLARRAAMGRPIT